MGYWEDYYYEDSEVEAIVENAKAEIADIIKDRVKNEINKVHDSLEIEKAQHLETKGKLK